MATALGGKPINTKYNIPNNFIFETKYLKKDIKLCSVVKDLYHSKLQPVKIQDHNGRHSGQRWFCFAP